MDEKGSGQTTLGSLERAVSLLGLERLFPPAWWTVVLFHHLTDDLHPADDVRVHGLGIDLPTSDFERVLDLLVERYEPVTLDRAFDNRRTTKPRVVITFDDAYASVAEIAAPILADRGLPWVFFVNPRFVGSRVLALDNLLTLVDNRYGREALVGALSSTCKSVRAGADVLAQTLPRLDPMQRRDVGKAVAEHFGIDCVAEANGLYLSEDQLRSLTARNEVEIGNHTRDHVHCRRLDARSIHDQVVASRHALEDMTGSRVRSFAYPYGARADATPLMTQALRDSGHETAFLVEGRLNRARTDRHHLHRISMTVPTAQRPTLNMTVGPVARDVRTALRTAGAH